MRKALALALLLGSCAPSPSAYTPASRAWIVEFGTGRVEAAAPFANIPALVHQPAIDLSSGGSKRSQNLDPSTRFVRVVCEVACVVQAGADASKSAIVLPAMRPEYFGITTGTTILSLMAVQ
jgi:hypothetical protein